MKVRMAWLLPLIVFVLHSLLLAGCTWMVLRSPDDPLAKVFFLPVVAIDLPTFLPFAYLEPTVDDLAETLGSHIGVGEASALLWAAWLGTVGPLHWLLLAWFIGFAIDKHRARRVCVLDQFPNSTGAVADSTMNQDAAPAADKRAA